jgi:isopropylmalate/homocitrate/citramalate synthase
VLEDLVVDQKWRGNGIAYHTGTTAIAHALSKQGLHISKNNARQLIPLIRKKAREQKKELSIEQLKDVYQLSKKSHI